MKEQWSDKSYNSHLTRWVEQLLPFEFQYWTHTRCQNGTGRLQISQTKSEVKSTSKNDEEFVVATITRIRDAIAAIYIITTPLNCQTQHINEVNRADNTRATNNQQKNYS